MVADTGESQAIEMSAIKKRNSDTPIFENHLDHQELQMKGRARSQSFDEGEDHDNKL